jgi:hypothetical protein
MPDASQVLDQLGDAVVVADTDGRVSSRTAGRPLLDQLSDAGPGDDVALLVARRRR